MYTAKDMYNDLKMKESWEDELIDKWLKETVLPARTLTGYQRWYDCPEDLTLCEAKRLLEIRGFSVKTDSDYQGPMIFLTIPLQGNNDE